MKLVSEQFLFYPEWAILQLHHGKLFLDDDDVTVLDQHWLFILLANWNNSPQTDTQL
jgi:hypothetical protein